MPDPIPDPLEQFILAELDRLNPPPAYVRHPPSLRPSDDNFDIFGNPLPPSAVGGLPQIGNFITVSKMPESSSSELYHLANQEGRKFVAKVVMESRFLVNPDEANERHRYEAEIMRWLGGSKNRLQLVESGQLADGRNYLVTPMCQCTLNPFCTPASSYGLLIPAIDRGIEFQHAFFQGLLPAVRGLAEAHDHGIIHRDFAPNNVLFLVGYGVLSDFGIALFHDHQEVAAGKSRGPAPFDTAWGAPFDRGYTIDTKVVLGNLRYMSPEQIRGDWLTPATDVFSLGVVLHVFAFGRHPFWSGDIFRPLTKEKNQEIKVATCRGGRINVGRAHKVPEEFTSLIDRCLAPKPEERPSAWEAVEGLKTVVRVLKIPRLDRLRAEQLVGMLSKRLTRPS